MKHQLPFLPASTFYDEYNKRHWYNGDYSKKYGSLVVPTRDTLINAIQLCAVQCSQGRPLENWELRSILHYYKSIEYKMNDLNFTEKGLGIHTETIPLETLNNEGIYFVSLFINNNVYNRKVYLK